MIRMISRAFYTKRSCICQCSRQNLPRKRHSPRQRGFTLLEMMIAVTLLTLMMAVLFSSLRVAARSWDRAQESLEYSAQQMQVANLLRRSLMQAVPVFWQIESYQIDLAFEGQPERLIWVAPLPAHQGGGGLFRLELGLKMQQNEAALVLTYRLLHPDTVGRADLDQEEILWEAVEALQIDYFGPLEHAPDTASQWQPEWRQRTQLPELIRLRLHDAQGAWPELLLAPRQTVPGGQSVTRLR